MRYAQIRHMDVSNGANLGVALFVQGCRFHCKNCFNSETWDFNGGKEWTPEIEEEFLNLIGRPYIKRVSILGGEPLEHPYPIFRLISHIREKYKSTKSIWLYSGYTWSEIMNSREKTKAILAADVLVDGRFEEDKKDLSLAFRGSTNQRLIAIKESLESGEVVLWDSKKGTT